MSVVIPDNILQAAGISEAELKLEIAIMLYQQRKLSTGKAYRLAGMNLIDTKLRSKKVVLDEGKTSESGEDLGQNKVLIVLG